MAPAYIAEVVAFLVVDRWGRRPTLLTGIGMMGAANAILVLAYALNYPATFTLLGILLFTADAGPRRAAPRAFLEKVERIRERS